MSKCFNCFNEINDTDKKCSNCGTRNIRQPLNVKDMMPGTILLSRYVIGYSVDHNTIFVTYIAWDNKTNKKVYINEYLPNNLSSRKQGSPVVITRTGEYEDKYYAGLEAFMDEADDLVHIESIDVISGFELNNTYYVVRAVIEDAVTLADLIDNDFERAKDYRKNILINMIKVINPIHDEGIIHGNISPETVYVRSDSTVIITDFGFCGYMSRMIPVYTNEGYSPIEQYSVGNKLSVASDVYSIAAIYYELMVGEIPISAKEREKQDTLIPPSKLGVKMKPSMENAILNALNIKIENRTQTVEDFYDELKSGVTKRNWERAKKSKYKENDFYKDRDFWLKFAISVLISLMLFSVIFITIETATIKKKAKSEETEISTESAQNSNFLNSLFGEDERINDDEPEENTKRARESTTEETTENTSRLPSDDDIHNEDTSRNTNTTEAPKKDEVASGAAIR